MAISVMGTSVIVAAESHYKGHPDSVLNDRFTRNPLIQDMMDYLAENNIRHSWRMELVNGTGTPGTSYEISALFILDLQDMADVINFKLVWG